MDFKNSTFMYILGGIVGTFVIAQSIYFLVKALRRGKAPGITGSVIKDHFLQRGVRRAAIHLHPHWPDRPSPARWVCRCHGFA